MPCGCILQHPLLLELLQTPIFAGLQLHCPLSLPRRLTQLSLLGCDLRSCNCAILASAVATVSTVHMDNVKLHPQQVKSQTHEGSFLKIFSSIVKVAELLRKASRASVLRYLSLDGVSVPEEVEVEGELLDRLRERLNLYTEAGGRRKVLTSGSS